MTRRRTDERDPWERLDNENDQAWLSFTKYMHLHPPRRLQTIADEMGFSLSTAKAYSWDYHWIARTKAWDEETARVEREAILAERQRIAREHLRAAATMRQVGAAELQRRAAQIARRHKANPDSDQTFIHDRDAVAMLKAGIDLERELLADAAASEQASLGSDAGVSDVDVSRLTPEEAEQLKLLLAKAGALS